MSYSAEKNPGLFEKYIPDLLNQLNAQNHNAVHRNIVRLLQFVNIPDTEAGQVMNICFEMVMKPKEPVANKAFALMVLSKLAKKYLEIKTKHCCASKTSYPILLLLLKPGRRKRLKN